MWKQTLVDLSNQTTKQISKIYCKSYAKSQPWASSWGLVWQSRSGSSAILSADISVATGNPKVKHCACVFVCFLFFCGYKTENRWVQKTQLAFTAAKLYISNLLWVTRQRAAACPFPGTDSPKFCCLEKQNAYGFSQRRFSHSQWDQASAHSFVGSSEPRLAADVPALLPPSGCAAMGTRSVSQSIRIPSVLHKSLPSVKLVFSEIKNSYQLLGRPETWEELGQPLHTQKRYEKPSWWLSALPFSMVYPI